MKKSFIIPLLIISCHSLINAQTAGDALRFSRIFYSGTARFNGLSGAFGAAGADFSTLATNPAGIGLYNASEMTFTIAPMFANSSSVYNGFTSGDNQANFGIGNFGVVFNFNTYDKNKRNIIRSINVAIGLNRQNDFNNRVAIHGFNPENSMMQSYANSLNAEKIDPAFVRDRYPFDLGLAYDANLLGYNPDPKLYYSDTPNGGVVQDKIINTSGSMNEVDISMGANLGDKVYIGSTIGIPTINYYEHSSYTETKADAGIQNFLSLNYLYDLHTHGTGVNFKFGLIYKPINWVRIGASIHTPTWYPSMRDQWSSVMQSVFTDSTRWNSIQYSPLGTYDYGLTTPFRAMGSVAFFVGAYGMVSAEYEYVNYSQARFYSSGDNYNDVNNEISATYQSWGNLRFGTEWRLADFRIRGGFGYFSNPFKEQLNNSERYQVSGGAGYRGKYFFADISYVWTRMNQDYYLYDASMVKPAAITCYTNTFLLTAGVRF